MFCRKCGSELGNGMFCPNCGTKRIILDNDNNQNENVQKSKNKSKKKLWIIAVVLILLAIVVAIAIVAFGKVKEKQEFAEYLEKGNRYLEELKYEKAEDFYLKAIAIAPKEAEPYIKLAEIYLTQEEIEKAKDILEQGEKAGAFDADDSKIEKLWEEIEALENNRKTEEKEEVEEERQTEKKEEKVILADMVRFESYYENSKEYAIIEGVDASGNIIWIYETGKYDATQLSRVSELGIKDDVYYFVDDGAVVALSLEDGSIIWKNADFGGSGMDCAFGPDGTIYVTGYFGPDLFVLDSRGNTVKKIDTFNSDYFWPYEVEYANGQIIITFEGNPSGDGQKTLCYVDLDDYSFEFR